MIIKKAISVGILVLVFMATSITVLAVSQFSEPIKTQSSVICANNIEKNQYTFLDKTTRIYLEPSIKKNKEVQVETIEPEITQVTSSYEEGGISVTEDNITQTYPDLQQYCPGDGTYCPFGGNDYCLEQGGPGCGYGMYYENNQQYNNQYNGGHCGGSNRWGNGGHCR